MEKHNEIYKLAQTEQHEGSEGESIYKNMYVMLQKVLANGATDFVFKLSPATKTTAAASVPGTRLVKVELVDRYGNLHKWFNGTITTSITTSSTSGTVTDVTSLKLVNGVGVISCVKAGTWTAADTNTVTASAQTILGVSVLAKTSVETAS